MSIANKKKCLFLGGGWEGCRGATGPPFHNLQTTSKEKGKISGSGVADKKRKAMALKLVLETVKRYIPHKKCV